MQVNWATGQASGGLIKDPAGGLHHGTAHVAAGRPKSACHPFRSNPRARSVEPVWLLPPQNLARLSHLAQHLCCATADPPTTAARLASTLMLASRALGSSAAVGTAAAAASRAARSGGRLAPQGALLRSALQLRGLRGSAGPSALALLRQAMRAGRTAQPAARVSAVAAPAEAAAAQVAAPKQAHGFTLVEEQYVPEYNSQVGTAGASGLAMAGCPPAERLLAPVGGSPLQGPEGHPYQALACTASLPRVVHVSLPAASERFAVLQADRSGLRLRIGVPCTSIVWRSDGTFLHNTHACCCRAPAPARC